MGKKDEEKSLCNKENNCEKTCLFNTTNDTDIIECSVAEYENKYNCLKTYVLDFKTPKVSEEKLGVLSNRTKSKSKLEHKNQDTKDFKGLNGSLRETVKKSYGLLDDALIAEKFKADCHLQTSSSVKNSNSHLVLNKIMSTVKRSPDGPYLSKTKLKNIEEWLMNNDVATIRTPPFANLSITPKDSKRKYLKTAATTTKKGEKENKYEDSSIDSEVEGVLRAVYGDDWKHSKTEPKRKLNSNYGTEVKKEKKSQSVRRNILSTKRSKVAIGSDEEVPDLDNSNMSGVKLMNLDISNCSEEFIKTKKLTNLRNKQKFEAINDSLESLLPTSAKKVKVKLIFDFENREFTAKRSTSKPDVLLKTPKKTFLASLSVSTPTSRCHPDAQYYKINFKSKKEELVKKLYKLYNGEIFEGKLAEDMNFSWNVKLRGTAGFCYNKRITKSNGEVIRLARVEFSTKIVDRADRLRDTMIHELCHAASWVIDGVLDGHGPIWGAWANKAATRFPELPPIKRCHNYDIASKYVYRCTGCGYSIKRHSKSINTERKRCGHCYGVLELLLNKKKKGKGEVPEFNITRTLRTPNKFALFVKENYHNVKSATTKANHAQIMKILSQQYALLKNVTKSEKKCLED